MSYLPSSTGHMVPLVAVQPWNCHLLWAACPDSPVLPFGWCSALRITENRLYAIPPCSQSSLGKGLRGDHHLTPRTQSISPWSPVVGVGSGG